MSMPHILNYVTHSMVERYLDHRYNCHKHFKKYATPSEARQHAYKNISQQDWDWLCNHFESDKFKEKVRKNVDNRKKLKYNHRGGSLSFPGHREKKRKAIGEQPNEIELFYITHFSIKKGWSNVEAQYDYEKMKEMEQEPIAKDGTPLSPKEIVDLVVDKNFRGFGFRPTLPTSRSRISSQVENEMQGIIDSQAKELESTRNELESTCTELGKTCDELKKCQTELTDTRAIVNKQQEHVNKQQERLDRIEKFFFTAPYLIT
ncbi:uncharacterized protein LOC102609798 isoform X1 [Citrus sinensis]|nr:uncharacterized protein LOC102609798 isoform X1 [Citrus sinensis]XP_052296342.1 uncharacterized protein LOC102609798 isoform X1 [Citrus sinensis]XP_052296343.1 uncharacterized protein LOC102609798 isoform X1 [Citrus sinensis]XP_052296344.1 uncharacterized protein LOC102609798 isoform X1 [Citrus sinensis]XP_052296345.1 uncharacterized protein LOC102609798 isoform X1 [Citrus sinensis]XP_052296346.1 uncharacterized protein LOC102609798 isoform X1 [Citrus sinensis]XP_052296347.1 uncharacterize